MNWEPKGDCVVQDDWSAVERYSDVDCECCTGMHFFLSLSSVLWRMLTKRAR